MRPRAVESLTKYYGVLALATREFCKHLSQPPDARLIDRVVVKGKSVALELFELRHKFSAENFAEIAKSYSEAFALYEQGKFVQAEALFRLLSRAVCGAGKGGLQADVMQRCYARTDEPG